MRSALSRPWVACSPSWSSVASELVACSLERRAELAELTSIYQRRGLNPELARQVAEELTAHDALTAHARDELGIDPDELSKPLEASVVSAASFALGALVPLLVVVTTSPGH